ncbi:hypothetical protein CAC42_4465 [Sphaceloma murrayae]|uniref:DNA polymerase delta subunit 4 n=1 Tax=Sphaceloma murrayae TaxID=2082308 RepID=A0A2K1QLN3_9PEZI|nr:hypothetical protein CAC42_4465 [Sphaceloma murrayae]
MPPKRGARIARQTRTSSGGGQGTLSFGSQHRITKPTTSPPSKKSKKDPAVLEAELKNSAPTDSALSTPKKRGPPPAEDPLASHDHVKAEDVLGGRATPEPEVEEVERDETEVEDDRVALALSPAKIKGFWRAKEQARLAPRVHQEGLAVGEKILREWDMSGQFGPCIGISRLARWRRARKLGLEPPVEVLGVLLGVLDGDKAERKGEEGGRAYVDLLMGSRFGVVA